jgi:hypothetical protein
MREAEGRCSSAPAILTSTPGWAPAAALALCLHAAVLAALWRLWLPPAGGMAVAATQPMEMRVRIMRFLVGSGAATAPAVSARPARLPAATGEAQRQRPLVPALTPDSVPTGFAARQEPTASVDTSAPPPPPPRVSPWAYRSGGASLFTRPQLKSVVRYLTRKPSCGPVDFGCLRQQGLWELDSMVLVLVRCAPGSPPSERVSECSGRVRRPDSTTSASPSLATDTAATRGAAGLMP